MNCIKNIRNYISMVLVSVLVSTFTTVPSVYAVEQGTLTSPGAPAAPVGLTAQSGPSTQILLRWDPVSGAQYYVVYRNEANVFSGLAPIGRTLITTSTYSDAGIPSTTYYYKVAAVNGSGEGYNSSVVSSTVCFVQPVNEPREDRGRIGIAIERGGTPPAPTQSPVPAVSLCPGVRIGGLGSEVGVSDGSTTQPRSGGVLWTPVDLSSKIVFKKLPSDMVIVDAGKRLNFDYAWVNKTDKNNLRNPNKKFVIKRRLWNMDGKQVLEKSAVHTILPGQSRSVVVNDILSKTLPSGVYTMEVTVSHYIPYADEEDIVIDRNSFTFPVSAPSSPFTPFGAWINPPPTGY